MAAWVIRLPSLLSTSLTAQLRVGRISEGRRPARRQAVPQGVVGIGKRIVVISCRVGSMCERPGPAKVVCTGIHGRGVLRHNSQFRVQSPSRLMAPSAAGMACTRLPAHVAADWIGAAPTDAAASTSAWTCWHRYGCSRSIAKVTAAPTST